MQGTYRIPRVVIAAAQSGSGKTTIATGLMAALRRKGLTVQAFKVGPDYIDPGYHRIACGRPGENLDSWLVPEKELPSLFARFCEGADIAVIEGVMGLYDGGRKGVSSTAAIAKLLHAPVLLVIDAHAMAASAAAVALGFRAYDSEINLAGVIFNRLGSDSHAQMVREACEVIGMPVYGTIRRNPDLSTPERYLGLLPTQENDGKAVVERWGTAVADAVAVGRIQELASSAPPLHGVADDATAMQQSEGGAPQVLVRIGIARDEAFSFYYEAGLQELRVQGAEIVPFSPLHDRALPEVDGLLIGGGFPEQFAAKLAANASMRRAIRDLAEAGMPIYAECGGYMYLMQDLVAQDGAHWPRAGVFSGAAVMTEKLQMVGYVTAALQQDTILGKAGTELHGHEFHFSREEDTEPIKEARPFRFVKLRNGDTYPAGQQVHHTLGSYLHLNFAGCPEAARHFLEEAAAWREKSSS